MLNIRVTAYPVGHEPHIEVTAGRHGVMQLLRLLRGDPMYCENNILILRLMIDPSTVPFTLYLIFRLSTPCLWA
jgi:hypothetical protein